MNTLLYITTILSLMVSLNALHDVKDYNSISLITFKSKDCQSLALLTGERVFGSDYKYLEYAGVMIVYKKQHEIALTFS